jgi:hypothetical protein
MEPEWCGFDPQSHCRWLCMSTYVNMLLPYLLLQGAHPFSYTVDMEQDWRLCLGVHVHILTCH